MPAVRRRVLRSALLATALAVSLSGTAHAADWSERYALGGWGTDPVEVVHLGGENVVAAFANYAGRLVFRRSKDGGQTWLEPVRVGPADDYYGSLAVSGAGTGVDGVGVQELPALADGESRQRIWYVRSADGARTFTELRFVSPKAAYAFGADVARDATGHVVVAWLERSPAYSDVATTTLNVRVSINGGGTFGPIQVLDTGPLSGDWGIWPAVEIANGVVLVVYGVDGGKLRSRRSADWGATWEPRTAVAEHTATGRPSLSIDGDVAYVAYAARSGAVGFRRSLDGGRTWSDFMRLLNSDGWSPTILATDGDIEAAFIREGQAWWDFDLVYRHSSDGVHWGPVEVLTSGGSGPSMIRVGEETVLMFGQWNGGDVGRVSRAYVAIRSD